jgi:2-phospho-L-lactate guanylyltransferase
MFAVVPIKRFEYAKTRLQPLLNPAERRRLACLMAADVLRAAGEAQSITGIAVVTDDPEARALARAVGAEVLPDPQAESPSLCRAVSTAFEVLRGRGISDLLYLPSDVPQVTPACIDLLHRHCTEGVSVVAARQDGGTNALILCNGASIPLSFGPGSSFRHAVQARQAGHPITTLHIMELATDIDTPNDLIALCRAADCRSGSQLFARSILEQQPTRVGHLCETP